MMASAMKEPWTSPGARIVDLDVTFVLQTLMSKARAPQLYFLKPPMIVDSSNGLKSSVIPALRARLRCMAVILPSDLNPTEYLALIGCLPPAIIMSVLRSRYILTGRCSLNAATAHAHAT